MLNDPRRSGELTRSEAIEAMSELGGRSGAAKLDMGWERDDGPPEQAGWYATLTYPKGQVIEVRDAASMDEACDALAVRLLHGGTCRGCGKTTVVTDKLGSLPVPAVVYDMDGVETTRTEESLREQGLCGWERKGAHWVRWCGDPAPEGSSRERLAQALIEVGAHAQQIAAARAGRYDDNLSPIAFPAMTLVAELEPYGERAAALIERVKEGEFDATPAETAAYQATPAGRAEQQKLFGELLGGLLRAEK